MSAGIIPCLATINAFKIVFHPRYSYHSTRSLFFIWKHLALLAPPTPISYEHFSMQSRAGEVLRPRQLSHTQVLLFFCLIQAGPGQEVGRIWLNKRLCLRARLAPQDPGAARTSSSPLVPRSQIHSLGAVYSVKQGAGRPPALIIEACPA